MMTDNFFAPIENTKPYFKAAFEGFAGSGKTYTSAQIAIGLHKRIKSKKPIVLFDTERASKFLKPLFSENNVEAIVRESRSMADLKETMIRCKDGIADILIIDSITHIWEDFLASYMRSVHRNKLQFQDWGIIKPTWKQEFSDPFVRDPYHIIMCGRAGFEYDNELNQDTNRRELVKTGIKMKVEGETAYEPDMLVLMERYQELMDRNKKVWREATVIKDRSTILDGKTFNNPSYEDFAPAIEAMMKDGVRHYSDAEKDSALLFRSEEDKKAYGLSKKKLFEEIEGYLVSVFPGQSAKDKKLKVDALEYAFKTRSWTSIQENDPTALSNGLIKIREFVANHIASEETV